MTETKEEFLLRFLRRKPASTQQCRDATAGSDYRLSSVQTEALLTELRDEGAIAYANGCWFVKNESHLMKPRGPVTAHPRQLKLFEE